MENLLQLEHMEQLFLERFLIYHLPIAMAFGVLVTIIFGLILEKFIIRYLYGRPLDSVVATWGISLIVSQSFLVIFGPSYEGLQTPMGNFQLGEFSYSEYRIFLIFSLRLFLLVAFVLFIYENKFWYISKSND